MGTGQVGEAKTSTSRFLFAKCDRDRRTPAQGRQTNCVINGQALRPFLTFAEVWRAPRSFDERPRDLAAHKELLLMRPPRLVFSRFLTYVCGHRATAVFAGGAAISEWIDRLSPPMTSFAAKPGKIVSSDAQLLCTLNGACASAWPRLWGPFLAAAANQRRECWSRPIERSSARRKLAFRRAFAHGSSHDTIAWTPLALIPLPGYRTKSA